MKILLVAPQPFYQERGTPIAVKLLVETLCEFGHSVDLLVYHAGRDIAIPGMQLIRAPRPFGIDHVPIGVSWQKIVCDVALVFRMAGLLMTRRFDVVHAVEEAVFPAVVLNALSKRKVVYDMDSSLSDQLIEKWGLLKPLQPVFRAIERFAVRRSTVTLAVCEDLAAKVRPWVDARRVVVLPDVPLDDVAGGPQVDTLRDVVGQHAVIGLYVGNLARYQGIDLLLQSIPHLPHDSRLRTVIIGGEPADIARYRKMAEELGVGEKVHFLGTRPVAQLNAYLSQADILVSPRILGTNTPMKVYSYMQSGKAIVATDIRSHTQALSPACAVLVAPEPHAVAAGLEQLAEDPALRARIGEAARATAEREYSLDAFRRRLTQAYETLVAA